MSSGLTIQQAAAKTGLSAYTLRYYERIDLIPSIERGSNGYRRYSEQDIDWIEFVKCLRSTGIPIADVQRYVKLQRRGDVGYAERLRILETHRDRLQARIEELSGFLERIEGKVEQYRKHLEP